MPHLLRLSFAFLLIVSFGACSNAGSSVPTPIVSHGAALLTASSQKEAALQQTAQGVAARINAGGGANGTWGADADYNGGAVAVVQDTINTSNVSSPAPEAVYQTQRYASNLSYVVPGLTAGGTYTVRLHFAESFFNSRGQRTFDVSINNSRVLTAFDIVATAGGRDIAVVESFTSNADSLGRVSVQFVARTNNASIAGIEIESNSASSTPAPKNNGSYPIFSSRFTGQPSPFHETVSSLVSRGARLESQTLIANLWAQGLEANLPARNGVGTATPIYLGVSSNATYTVSCSAYGTCNAAGMRIHFPENATPQANSDGHLVSVDTVLGGEFDGWKCGQGSLATCSWGGWFPFSGNGLDHNSGNNANAAGYAFGLFTITAQELLNGRIDHSLGMIAACLDNPNIYPADTNKSTDTSCSGTGRPSPSAHYGDLIHLKSSYNVSGSGYGSVCKTILTALQNYGAYTVDTNGDGLVLEMEYGGIYPSPNPYYTTIYPSLASAGDGSGSNSGFNWHSCLQRLNSSDLELYSVASGT